MHWCSDSICSIIEEQGLDLGIFCENWLFDKWVFISLFKVKVAIKLCIEQDTNVWFISNFVWVNDIHFYW